MKILFASSNKHKAKEIKHILSEHEVITLDMLNDNDDVEETSDEYEGNAFLKADHFYQKYKMPVIADDSGISVEAMDGGPGVYSARYLGEDTPYLPDYSKYRVVCTDIADVLYEEYQKDPYTVFITCVHLIIER